MLKKSLEFYIKSNDHFGTLTAVLSLIKQIPKNSEANVRQ